MGIVLQVDGLKSLLVLLENTSIDFFQSQSMEMNNYTVINSQGKEMHAGISLHPGDILLDELETRKMGKAVFAEKLGMKPSHFSELLHGKRNVSAATALKLEKVLGIAAEFWMRVQVYHDLFVERHKQEMRPGIKF